MNHTTSIGLDVHARSITAAAFNPLTGEIVTKSFGYSPAEVASWALSFEDPKAVYETGVTGFHLCRELNALGLDTIVGATSKMVRPSADIKRKNDTNDAIYLAKLLSMHNITEVFVPDSETEAMRNLARSHFDVSADLTRAKQRLNHFLIRHGYPFCEKNPDGTPKGNWTNSYWQWVRKIELPNESDEEAFAYYISEVRHLEAQKKELEKFIRRHAQEDRWRSRIDALRCLKGLDTISAFAIVVETGVFSRFSHAREYSAWLGLVPSEYSSGQRVANGSITKTGNSFVRRILIESSWHYVRASKDRKKVPNTEVPLRIENHAAKATKRLVERRAEMTRKGKRPVVANCATARELACWIWAIGRMAEASL